MPPNNLSAAVSAILIALAVSAAPATTTTTATATATAATLPRLFNGFGETFKVRPHTVSLICASGGELVLTWNRWTSKSASGTGRTRPCRGSSLRVHVKAFRPVRGYFTRLNVKYKGYSTGHLGLGRMGGSMSWIDLEWMADPDSGSTPWPS
jgi:hypothetical protein